jgi:hypothetical protein
MSSGQSPFAFVHVGPPGLACTTKLQQVQLVNAKYQQNGKQDPNATLRLLESYPLSNTEFASVSPNRSAAATPDLTGNGWGPHHGQHLQKQDLHQVKKQTQLRQNGSSSGSGGGSREQPQVNGISRHRQQDGQQDGQQEGQRLQQQQQKGVTQLSPQAGIGKEQSVFEDAAAAAAAAAAADGEGLGEVYTPYDSPFYQDLDMGSWAPSASVCGLDSQPNSLSVRASSSAMMAAGVVMFSSDSGLATSPFAHLQQQLQQAGPLSAALLPLPSSGSVAGTEASIVQPDGSTTAAPSLDKPVLKEALTIEYQAGMTPMAAAAAEAVAVHASRRSIPAVLGSQPGSRPASVNHGGPYTAAAAAVAAAVASGALPVSINGAAAGSSGAGSSGGGSQADVAASADNGGPAAANVLVDGLIGKAQSAPVKSPPRGTTPVSDQQQKLRGWRSHIDAPKAAAAGGGAAAAAAGGGAELVRPVWMRLLGIRRSLPGVA